MEWTSAKPTKAGWYWCRLNNKTELTYVREDGTCFTFCPPNFRFNYAFPVLAKEIVGWAGPLIPPEEP